VLDFAGNAGKHALVSPLDVLAGRYTDEEISLAKELGDRKPRERADRLLELAREELKARAAAAQRMKSRFEAFDPFEVFHMDAGADELDWQFGAKPPTEGQINFARKLGIDGPEKLSRRRLSDLLGAAKKRIDLGLASYKQLKTLQRNGITDINIRFEAASAIIDALARNRWRPLDRNVVDGLIGRTRAPEDEGWGA
jgi:hypothetical protein